MHIIYNVEPIGSRTLLEIEMREANLAPLACRSTGVMSRKPSSQKFHHGQATPVEYLLRRPVLTQEELIDQIHPLAQPVCFTLRFL